MAEVHLYLNWSFVGPSCWSCVGIGIGPPARAGFITAFIGAASSRQERRVVVPPPRCQRKRCHPPILAKKGPKNTFPHCTGPRSAVPVYELKQRWVDTGTSLQQAWIPWVGGWWVQEPLRHAPITLPTPTSPPTRLTSSRKWHRLPPPYHLHPFHHLRDPRPNDIKHQHCLPFKSIHSHLGPFLPVPELLCSVNCLHFLS